MTRWLTLRSKCTVAELAAGGLCIKTGDGRILGFPAQARPLLELLLTGIPEPELERIRELNPKLNGVFLSMDEQGLTVLSPSPRPSQSIAPLAPAPVARRSLQQQDRLVASVLIALAVLQLGVAACSYFLATPMESRSANTSALGPWFSALCLSAWIVSHEYAHFLTAKSLGVQGGTICWTSRRRILPCFRAPEQGVSTSATDKIFIFLAGPIWDTLFLLAWGSFLFLAGPSDSDIALWLLICAASLGNAAPTAQSDLGQTTAALRQLSFRASQRLQRLGFAVFCGYSFYIILCALKSGVKVATRLLS